MPLRASSTLGREGCPLGLILYSTLRSPLDDRVVVVTVSWRIFERPVGTGLAECPLGEECSRVDHSVVGPGGAELASYLVGKFHLHVVDETVEVLAAYAGVHVPDVLVIEALGV